MAVLMQSCYKPGEIQIRNNISQVEIMDVKWGDIYVATDLMPGETSGKYSIPKSVEKLPKSNHVSFKMTANNKTVYLETQEEFLLEEDGDLLIVLDDDTQVVNPND